MLNWISAYGIPWAISSQEKARSTRDGTCPLERNVPLPDLPSYSCTFRADPVHKGDKVVPPASFPAAPPPDPKMIPDELPTVSDEVLDEVRQNPRP